MTECSSELLAWKRQLRFQAQRRRKELPDRDERSRLIWSRLLALPECAAAGTVMAYLDLPSEVRTRPHLPILHSQGKQVVVPYCLGDELALFRLDSLDELDVGALGILEPKSEWRNRLDRRVEAGQLDLILVPGVAFDRQGGRLGRGKGYYDRLLRLTRCDATLVGLAFECQLFPAIPVLPHDVFMDKVISEEAVYPGRGRPRSQR